jgi:hypothetical protein
VRAPPELFNGDPANADRFLDGLKQYFRLNWGNVLVRSPLRRTTLALTFIQGPAVSAWTRDVGDWLDRMLEDRNAYDVAAVWRYFLEEFKAQFQDTQLTMRARQKVRTLKMQWPHVDQYIRDFEALVRAAKYDTDNPETVDLFIEGLSSSIRKDVFAPPMPTTYRAIKRKAIEVTASSRFLDELAKKEQQ